MGWVRSLLNAVSSTPVSCIVPVEGTAPQDGTPGDLLQAGSWELPVQGFRGVWKSEPRWDFTSTPPARKYPPPLARRPYLKACLSSKAGVFKPCFWRRCRWRKSRTFRIKALLQSGGHLALLPAHGAQTSTSWPLRVCWDQMPEHSASVLSWGKRGLFAFFMLLYLESISSTIYYFRNCF